jgi:hypothetical protein
MPIPSQISKPFLKYLKAPKSIPISVIRRHDEGKVYLSGIPVRLRNMVEGGLGL